MKREGGSKKQSPGFLRRKFVIASLAKALDGRSRAFHFFEQENFSLVAKIINTLVL
jgi:hypothetical protein